MKGLTDALLDVGALTQAQVDEWMPRLFGPTAPGTAPWDPWLDREWRRSARESYEQIADYYDSDPHVVFQAAQLVDWDTVPVMPGLEHLAVPGAQVLDYGCGSGRFGIGFARAGCAVTFCDVSPRILAGLRRLAASRGASVQIFCPREGEAPPVEKFDLVVAGDVLEHVKNPEAMLQALVASLRPGGHLWQHVFFGGHELAPYHLAENFGYGVPGVWDEVSARLGLAQTGIEGLWRRAT